jgi:hypothetical protein
MYINLSKILECLLYCYVIVVIIVCRKSWMTLLTWLIAQCLPSFNVVSEMQWFKALIWEGATYKTRSIISANFQKSGGSYAYPDSDVAPPLVWVSSG